VTVAAGHEPRVRAATASDLGELARLADRAHAALDGERGGDAYRSREARTEPWRSSLRDDLADAATLVLLGSLGEVAVGYAVASVEPRRGSDLAVVRDLYVEPEARGVGLGRDLMDQVVGWATERACGGIDASVLPGDRATKNFFEGFGLVARLITVHRDLDGDA
jgi:GNAT superfamily N-acetyltransferase